MWLKWPQMWLKCPQMWLQWNNLDPPTPTPLCLCDSFTGCIEGAPDHLLAGVRWDECCRVIIKLDLSLTQQFEDRVTQLEFLKDKQSFPNQMQENNNTTREK